MTNIQSTEGTTFSSGAPGASQSKLTQAAHQFEASLMAELLKPLQEDTEEGESGSGGALAGFASESLAKAISERGGFGIAEGILHQFTGQSTANPAGAERSSRPQGASPGPLCQHL
jgi:Rod binding domain-containing protein